MEGESETRVTLHGTWASAFSKRVELALKIKGIPYEFVEEDLANKSPVLLKYNPIHKKVPVLVHNGKPIVESSVILQYIDETWRVAPHLLPDDPYKRAKVRFWVSFIQQQLFEAMRRLISLDGELQQEAIQEVMDRMKVLEEGMKEFFPGGIGKMETTKLGLLDILVTATFGSYKVYEEVIGAQILVPEKNPLIHSWVMALNELPVVQELKPPYDKLVTVVQNYRQNALKSSK